MVMAFILSTTHHPGSALALARSAALAPAPPHSRPRACARALCATALPATETEPGVRQHC